MSQTTGVTTMRAVTQSVYGGPEVFQVEQRPLPEVRDDEVLVRVSAAGVDRGTWHLMTGRPYLLRLIGFGFRRPKNSIPGLDVSGTVVALGADVTGFAVGDEVYGISRGSFAEYAAAQEDKLSRKPEALTHEQAAVVPISSGTALQALEQAGVTAGQRVLVTGASGGVGTFAVQLAKAYGAEVTGTCSAAKIDLVRALGADVVLDYATDDFTDGSRRWDVIIDIGGNTSLRRLRRALTPRGTLVIVGGEGEGRITGGFGRSLRAPLLSLFVRQRLTMLASKEQASDQERLRPLLESGQVRPSLDRTYSLEHVPDALRHLEAGAVRGKVAITVP